MLAYEICHMIDGRLLSYLMKVDKTNGALLLKTLNSAVTRGSAERTAALHNRFAAQSPCKTKEQLLHGLQAWKEDLEELQATGSCPGKETVMSSMKLLISGMRELKTVMEIIELLAPGDVRRLYNVVHKKTAEWAVLDSNSHVVNAMAATSTKGDVQVLREWHLQEGQGLQVLERKARAEVRQGCRQDFGQTCNEGHDEEGRVLQPR